MMGLDRWTPAAIFAWRLPSGGFAVVSAGGPPRLQCGAPLSPADCCWHARHTPSIQTNGSPNTCTPPGEHRMDPRRPPCLRSHMLGRVPLVFVPSRDLPLRWNSLPSPACILAKLDANDRTHAAMIGLKRGIIELQLPRGGSPPRVATTRKSHDLDPIGGFDPHAQGTLVGYGHECDAFIRRSRAVGRVQGCCSCAWSSARSSWSMPARSCGATRRYEPHSFPHPWRVRGFFSSRGSGRLWRERPLP